MDATPGSWSTSRLIEFLALLTTQTDEAAALHAAVERVLEALDAEVGVMFVGDRVLTTVGLGPDADAGAVAVADLLGAAAKGAETVDLPGLGTCRTAVVALDSVETAPRLVIARAGCAEFVPDELLLLRGMAWVLDLAVRPLRMMAALDERQGVIEQVARIQHAIATRAPLPEVLDAVTEGALGLFGNELAALYLVDGGQLVRASVSSTLDGEQPLSPPKLHQGAGDTNPAPAGKADANPSPAAPPGAAFLSEEPVRTDDYASAPYALPELVERGARSAMAAPVRENGIVVGSLVVVSFQAGHAFTESQERTLLTFADQVSVALSDATTLATAQHAIRDPVTGLPNRVLFLQRLEQAVARATDESPVHVLFVDLDRFKFVNDSLGHEAGDDLLRQVGRRLRECLRSEDTLARFGGDEYAVLVEGAAEDVVRRLGERILAALQAPYLVKGNEAVVDGSIGVAVGHSGDPGDLMRDADTAMYRAKNAGGGRLVFFEKSMHTSLIRRVSLETDLRRAIDSEQLFVVFQPIVRMRSGEVHSAEALVRWQHPTWGTVSPAEFIPLAEETGLIHPIGRRVLAAACLHAVGWQNTVDGRPPPFVSVNLSARQLLDPGLVNDIRGVVDATGIDPERLVLEITESALVTDTSAVLERLHQIRETGARLAIDDFGTGYSSLAYLRMFPVNILKIDRSFVEGAVSSWQGDAFLRTIIRLTDTLNMTAIGEGVETMEQLQVLQRIGCPLGQGYLFAQGLPPEQFEQYLAASQPMLAA